MQSFSVFHNEIVAKLNSPRRLKVGERVEIFEQDRRRFGCRKSFSSKSGQNLCAIFFSIFSMAFMLRHFKHCLLGSCMRAFDAFDKISFLFEQFLQKACQVCFWLKDNFIRFHLCERTLSLRCRSISPRKLCVEMFDSAFEYLHLFT